MSVSATAKFNCKACGKNVWCDQMEKEGKDCDKKKCWLRKPKAVDAAADAAGCSVDDFLKPEIGGIIMHKEPTTSHFPIDEHYTNHGYQTSDC